jgi:hypothetical protein
MIALAVNSVKQRARRRRPGLWIFRFYGLNAASPNNSKRDVEYASEINSPERRPKMTKKQKDKRPTRRTEVKELPKQEKELSQDEQKRVKGGNMQFLALQEATQKK